MGKTMIVDQVQDKINLNLLSIMKRKVIRHGGKYLIQFNRKHYTFDKSFNLFVVCNKIDPHFDVDVTNYVTLINFTINFESLNS